MPSAKPDMNITFSSGAAARSRSASSWPPIPGIVRSVRSTSTRLRAGQLERLVAVRREQHLVAVAPEHLVDEPADHLLVLDDEHARRLAARAGAGDRGGDELGLDRRLHDAVGAAEVDREGGADAELAVDGDVAAALLHDPVDGREPQARALAGLLGGEERLEDLA